MNSNGCNSDWDCEDGSFCPFGVCVPKCSKIICPPNTKCLDGECVPDLEICPADSEAKYHKCTVPRPNQQSCPLIYYFRAPDPNFCGVKADGTRVNFARECEACKDSSIIYYFDEPCYDAPVICNDNQTCLGYYCGNDNCRSNSDCPYDWQNCIQGKCLDRCALLKCANCKYGQCGYSEDRSPCQWYSDCQPHETCWGFECVDECLRTACPANHKCKKGECVKEY